jgi:hypothetical protein
VVKLAKRKPGPLAAPVAATLFIQRSAAPSDYSQFNRYAGLLPDAAALFPEPVLYLGKPHGWFVGQCAFILTSAQMGYIRNVHSGLRFVCRGPHGQTCFVGDYKRNYRDSTERGRTLIAVFDAPSPGRPGCLMLFITARTYARKRPKANAVYAQRLFREYVGPRLSVWLQAVPIETQLF